MDCSYKQFIPQEEGRKSSDPLITLKDSTFWTLSAENLVVGSWHQPRIYDGVATHSMAIVRYSNFDARCIALGDFGKFNSNLACVSIVGVFDQFHHGCRRIFDKAGTYGVNDSGCRSKSMTRAGRGRDRSERAREEILRQFRTFCDRF